MYTSQANIEAFLGRDLTASEVEILDLLLSAVDAWINAKLGGVFGDVSATTRYYDGGSSILDIDPCNTITKVAHVDSEEQDIYEYELNVDYETRPRNETQKSWIESRIGCFPAGVANISVTAKFTLGALPDDIEYLATYLASNMISKNEVGNLKSETIEGYSRTFGSWEVEDNTVNEILSTYLSKSGEVYI